MELKLGAYVDKIKKFTEQFKQACGIQVEYKEFNELKKSFDVPSIRIENTFVKFKSVRDANDPEKFQKTIKIMIPISDFEVGEILETGYELFNKQSDIIKSTTVYELKDSKNHKLQLINTLIDDMLGNGTHIKHISLFIDSYKNEFINPYFGTSWNMRIVATTADTSMIVCFEFLSNVHSFKE
jgi:hypothetical protein